MSVVGGLDQAGDLCSLDLREMSRDSSRSFAAAPGTRRLPSRIPLNTSLVSVIFSLEANSRMPLSIGHAYLGQPQLRIGGRMGRLVSKSNYGRMDMHSSYSEMTTEAGEEMDALLGGSLELAGKKSYVFLLQDHELQPTAFLLPPPWHTESIGDSDHTPSSKSVAWTRPSSLTTISRLHKVYIWRHGQTSLCLRS